MAKPTLTKLAYKTLQQGKSLAGLAHKELSNRAMDLLFPDSMPEIETISLDLLKELQNSITELESIDWEEAEEGIYPKTLLFNLPWIDWTSKYPLLWLDLPSTWSRRKYKKVRDIPNEIDPEKYPDYYLQNFHHQTDGYLSDHSAKLYDIQVEILFNGTADSMRRRVLSPLKKGLEIFSNRKSSSIRVLDVATGTGRTLHQIKGSMPNIELLGIDLSSAYLKKATKYLNNKQGPIVQLIRGNAESLPFEDESIQGVTCVYLFHELPPKTRERVLEECFRVIETGGVFILADSIQICDTPNFKPVMENFSKVFHEPYYKDYINYDIDKKLEEAGFNLIKAESYFMTRVWSCCKP